MPAELNSDDHVAIGHVLFLDVVGYSKLLANEQKQVVTRLTELVRQTPEFQHAEAAGQLVRIPTGDGMVLVFSNRADAPVRCAVEIVRALETGPRIALR